jgi:hypothetical protein
VKFEPDPTIVIADAPTIAVDGAIAVNVGTIEGVLPPPPPVLLAPPPPHPTTSIEKATKTVAEVLEE